MFNAVYGTLVHMIFIFQACRGLISFKVNHVTRVFSSFLKKYLPLNIRPSDGVNKHLLKYRRTNDVLSVSYIQTCTSLNSKPSYNNIQKYIRNRSKVDSVNQNKPHAKFLRAMYAKNKNNSKDVPSQIDLLVLGPGSEGTPSSFVIVMDHSRYMFNCGEGTQRLSMGRFKIAHLEDIFVTHNSWKNLGGLMGIMLTQDGLLVPSLRLHGPPKVEKLLTEDRVFASSLSIKIDVEETNFEKPYVDCAMTMYKVPLFPDEVESSSDSPKAKRRRVAAASEMCVAYVGKPHKKVGRLDVEKCVELGVPRGPLFRELKSGKTITLSNGNEVKPEDVIGDSEDIAAFLVVECPDARYLDPLRSNDFLTKCQRSAGDGQKVNLVLHMSSSGILSHPKYIDWITRFDEGVTHIAFNEDCCPFTLQSVYKMQATLNLIDQRVFPLLRHQVAGYQIPSDKVDVGGVEVWRAQTGLALALRKRRDVVLGVQKESCISIKNQEVTEEILSLPEVSSSLASCREHVKMILPCEEKLQFPKITFLGTGSSIPSSYRNVSAIWVDVSGTCSVLLDCGEGTFNQLHRFFNEKTEEMLKKLKVIFISHLHSDHHAGLWGILMERHRLLPNEETFVISPSIHVSWLNTLKRCVCSSPSIAVVHLASEWFYPASFDKYAEEIERFLERVPELKKIETVRVIHRRYPHGIVLTSSAGVRLAYSGDTMYCREFVDLGKDCDILIHEATLDDSMAADAIHKRHSTTSEAIKVGIEMNAGFTLLTHISQRFSKIPLITDCFHPKVGIAFDFMQVCPEDFPKLHLYNEVYKKMFFDSMDTQSSKAQYREAMSYFYAEQEIL